METKPQIASKKRIGELLLDADIIRAEELPVGLKQASERSLRLGEVLVMLRYLSAEDLEAVLQAQTKLADGEISERRAIEALKIASAYRITFNKALEQVAEVCSDSSADLVQKLDKLKTQLAEAESIHGKNSRDVASINVELGDLSRQMETVDDAEAYYKRALQILEHSFGPRNLKVAGVLMKLADLLFSENRLAEAETLQWRVLEITQQAFGNEHLDVATCKKSLARILEAQCRFKEAEQMYLSSLRIIEGVAGEDHPELIDGLRHLAKFWLKQGKRPERKRLGDLLIEAGLLKSDQVHLALQQVSESGRPLGRALIKLNFISEEDLKPALQAQLLIGDGVLPLPIAVKALRIARQRRTFEDALTELGWEPDKFTTAELRTLISAAEELLSAEIALGPQHAGVAILTMKLADIYCAQNKPNEAEPLYQRSVEILEKSFGPKDAEVATALYKIALLNISLGKFMEAEHLVWRAIEIRQAVHGPDHSEVADCLEALAQLQEKQQDLEQAEKFYQSAITIREKCLGLDHPKTMATMRRVINAYYIQQKFDEAESYLLRALRTREKIHGSLHPELTPLLEQLAQLYASRKEYSKAETQLELALDILERSTEPSSLNTDEALERLLNQYLNLLKQLERDSEAEELRSRIQQISTKSPKS